MTKKISIDMEERYQAFDIYEAKEWGSVIISDKLFERFKKIQCIAEEMRDYIHTKMQRGFYKRLNVE